MRSKFCLLTAQNNGFSGTGTPHPELFFVSAMIFYLALMKYTSFAALLLLFTACGDEKKPTPVDSVPAVQTAKPTISAVQPLRPNIDLMPWQGNLNDAIYWVDSRGENAVVISSKPQYFWEDENPDAESFFPDGEDEETLSELTEIFATHFVLKSGEGKWKVHNTYHDYLFGCCDVFMAYQPGSLQVMDADTNGTGEAMFVYHQTEGDGMISHTFNGTLVLELDSAYYTIEDETGLGTELARQGATVVSDQIVLKTPEKSVYKDLMFSKWDEFYKLKVEQDRAELTEQNNVDESGHADHQH